jgi:hypothetical protein
MDSEKEISRRYADLTMIRRSDMRQVKVNDILIEFKFVPLSKVGLSGEQTRSLSSDALQAISAMKEKMADALAQVDVNPPQSAVYTFQIDIKQFPIHNA